MTFATEIAKQSSERTILARVTARRNVTSTLVVDSGSVYVVAMPSAVSAVTRQGVALTAVSAYPPAPGRYFHDVTGKLLYTNDATPNVSTAVYIVSYSVYLCTGSGIATYDDPSTTTGTIRQWQPRLSQTPSFGSFFDNPLAGVFSFNDLTLAIANGDSWFQQFLTADDSFKRSDVAIWYFINDISNIQKMYQGQVTGVSGREGEISLTVSDSFNRLRDTAFMGDTADESYFEFAGFPSVDPNKNGTPCRFVTGSSSPYKKEVITIYVVASALGFGELSESCNQGVVTSFSATATPSRNRNWGLHRAPFVSSAAMKSNSFTAVTNVFYLGENDFLVALTGANANYRIGETFRWSEGGFTWCAHVTGVGPFQLNIQTFTPANVNVSTDRVTLTAHGLLTGDRISLGTSALDLPDPLVEERIYYVNKIDNNTIEICRTPALATAGTQINITSQGTGTHRVIKYTTGTVYGLYLNNACRQDDPSVDHDPEDNFSTAAVSVSTPAVAAQLRYGANQYLDVLRVRYGADYTVVETATSGGNRYLELQFEVNAELNLHEDNIAPPAINPNQHQLLYAVQHASPMTHGVLLKRMVEKAGLVANAASFTQADIDLAAFTYMQIPTTRESDFGSYFDYAKRVLRSTLGFMTVNALGEVVYKLIATPSSGFAIDANNAAISDFTIDYNDIARLVIFYNEDLADNPVLRLSSSVTRYLHLSENVDRFVHVLANISARSAAIFNLKKNRYAVYKFSLAHTGSALILGDDVSLSSVEILGGSGTVSGKVTGLVISADAIDVEATDLLST